MTPPKPQPAVALKPADFRPPPNGDRVAMSESGREWVHWVEGGFMQLCTAINRLATQIEHLSGRFGELNNNVIALGSSRPPPMRGHADSWEEITGVQTIEAAKDAARDYRERLAEEKQRTADSEAKLAAALANDAAQLAEAQAEKRQLLRWVRIIIVTFITVVIGGAAVYARREFNAPLSYPPAPDPHWVPGP